METNCALQVTRDTNTFVGLDIQWIRWSKVTVVTHLVCIIHGGI